MPVAPSEKLSQPNDKRFKVLEKPSLSGLGKKTDVVKRAILFVTSPTTQDLIDAIQNDQTILIEDKALRHGLIGFEGLPGELALSLTSLTAYLIDISAVLDYFLLHKTSLHPVLCEQILTSTHEVVSNALLWSNLEIECADTRQKSLNFGDAIKDQLKNTTLAKRLIKINLHVTPESVDVVVISSGRGFDWKKAIAKVSTNVQGLAIIHSCADSIMTENEGKTLRLKFYS